MTGAFSRKLQRRRIRKRKKRNRPVNQPLVEAICAVVPPSETILDIGAGYGQYVSELLGRGYLVYGIDGTSRINRLSKGLVQQKDLTSNCQGLYDSVDWGLFFEVGEHVPKEDESTLIDQVSRIPRKGLIVSWATVGQRGSGHVNCQLPSYIIDEFCKRGWELDSEKMGIARGIVDRRLRKRLLVFRKAAKK